MRDNPSLTTWVLLAGGGFAFYKLALEPRMKAAAAARAAQTGEPVK